MLLLLPLLARAAAAAPAAVRLNEVLYDAPGPDRGHEFIELVLPGRSPVALDGFSIERGNGSRPDDWRTVWRGSAADTLRPGGFFVVGGEAVEPPADVTLELGLQNGPDACRLLVGGQVTDLLGWGEHTYGEYSEGAPAPAVPAGGSLGRVPDGLDTDSNARDWLPLAAPSPGAANRPQPPFRLGSPGHRSLGGGPEYVLELSWRAAPGRAAVPAALRIEARLCGDAPVLAAADWRAGEEDGAGGTLRVPELPAGIHRLCLTAAAGDGAADSVQVTVRAGPGSLRITEIMARPERGAPEWVEVLNASDAGVDLRACALSDARLVPVPLAEGQWLPDEGRGELRPGELALLTAAALEVDGVVQVVLDRWPALNDGGDGVRLLDGAGRTIDDVAYAADWAPAGSSFERLAAGLPSEERASWLPRAGGSPGVFAPARSALGVPAGFLRAGRSVPGGPLLLELAEPLRAGRLIIYRMDGGRVLELTGAALRGRRQLVWGGDGAPGGRIVPGLYLARLEGERWGDGRAVRVRVMIPVAP